jgi:hypothetical protein
LINGITIFGEFFWLFKRALSGKVMDVLADSKQDNAPIGQFHQGQEARNQLWVLNPVVKQGR